MSTQLMLREAKEVIDGVIGELAGPRGPVWLHYLKKSLRDGPTTASGHKICWTLELGKIPALYNAVLGHGFAISDAAADMMFAPGLVQVSKTVRKVNLAVYSVGDLLLASDDAMRWSVRQICIAAEGHGLKKCHSEVPALLRIEYSDQPMGEYLHVPIAGSEGAVFGIGRFPPDIQILGGIDPDLAVYGPHEKFVFEIGE